MPSKRTTHRLQGLTLLLLSVLSGNQGPIGAFAEQSSVLIEGEQGARRTRVHLDFRITIPAILEVIFPSSSDEGAIPQILSNVGLLIVTVDDEAYTYVAMSEQERLLFIGESDATSQTLVSGLPPEGRTHVEVYTVAIP